MGREAGSQWFLEKSEQDTKVLIFCRYGLWCHKELHYNIKDHIVVHHNNYNHNHNERIGNIVKITRM